MIAGSTDPSTTHKLSTPWTRHRLSTTAAASPSPPIGAVLDRCCDVDQDADPTCAVAPANSRASSAPAVSLAMSFGLYGLVKKKVGASLDAMHSLAAETAVLAPVALVVLVVLYAVYVLPQLDGDAADVTVLEVAAADAAVLEAAAIEARDKAKHMGDKQAAAKAAETDVAAKSEGRSGGRSCGDERVHEASTDGAKSIKEEEMEAE